VSMGQKATHRAVGRRGGWLPGLAVGRGSVVVVVGLLLLGAAGGCGYRTGEMYPTEYATVAVPVFENQTFYRGAELELTEAVVKEIESRTPYEVVAADRADTVLEGTITRIEQDRISRNRTGGVPQQMEVTITVDFQWTRRPGGRTMRDRRGFEAVGRYAPSPPVSQPYEQAQHVGVSELARQIVGTMQADWAEDEAEAAPQASGQDVSAAPVDGWGAGVSRPGGSGLSF